MSSGPITAAGLMCTDLGCITVIHVVMLVRDTGTWAVEMWEPAWRTRVYRTSFATFGEARDFFLFMVTSSYPDGYHRNWTGGNSTSGAVPR
ncbi:MAG: hypothetical protein AB1646_16810 [Thermodesulfobacteriota bacterium]